MALADAARRRLQNKAHPGFKNVASDISKKQGIPLERAKAILASRTRQASPLAKRLNPRLKKV